MFFRTLFTRFAVCAAAAVCAASVTASAQNSAPAKLSEFTNHATVWPDNNGAHISAHGGCMLKVGDTYYWYGEHRARDRRTGVHVYSSKDLYNWKDEGLAFNAADMQMVGQQAGGRRGFAFGPFLSIGLGLWLLFGIPLTDALLYPDKALDISAIEFINDHSGPHTFLPIRFGHADAEPADEENDEPVVKVTLEETAEEPAEAPEASLPASDADTSAELP